MARAQDIIPVESIASRIYLMRGEKVMLDSDLAQLYGVQTMRLNEQFKRNRDRFPADFAFQMTKEEFESLISQSAISNIGRGGRRTLPWAFTEHGVAMLSSVLQRRRSRRITSTWTICRLRRSSPQRRRFQRSTPTISARRSGRPTRQKPPSGLGITTRAARSR